MAVIGFAESVAMWERRVAPVAAPIAPGTPRVRTTRQLTLPNRQWLSPEARVVPTSAAWTTADAWAGPMESSRMVVDVTPKPMPMPPSTSCANAPAKMMSIVTAVSRWLRASP